LSTLIERKAGCGYDCSESQYGELTCSIAVLKGDSDEALRDLVKTVDENLSTKLWMNRLPPKGSTFKLDVMEKWKGIEAHPESYHIVPPLMLMRM
jgi:hypothetical protein